MYLFFDTETTGLPDNWNAPTSNFNNWPRMVQLAYLLYDTNGQLVQSKDFIIKPNGYTIPSDSSRIHGISTQKALTDGIEIDIVLADFQTMLNKATHLIAHNMGFDEKIIGAEFYRLKNNDPLVSKSKFCTMKNSSIISYCAIPPIRYGSYKYPKLSELHYKLFKTGFEEAHNAVIDITVTAKCFWELKNKGIITLHNDELSGQIETIKNIESSETSNLRKLIGEHCEANNFKEIPLGAKADALMHLNFKFKQLDIDTNIDEEFTFLLDYWRTNDSNLFNTTVNSLQKEFLNIRTKLIIEEHKSFPFFSDEKIKTIEDGIMQLEVLSVLSKANVKESYRDLVSYLYYYFLSAYKDYLPENNKPKEFHELEKVDYSNVSDVTKKSHENFKKLMNEFSSILSNTRNGNIPESIYDLVNSCNKELTIIKSEIGKEHKLYTESSNEIVYLSTTMLSEWIKSNHNLLTFSVQGMSLGNNLLEVCSATFEAVDKIETTGNGKNGFNKTKASFDSIKQSLQPKSGCYIATMTYGNYNHPQVIHLRKFRDNKLRKTSFGKLFIKVYYAISPTIVALCKDNKLIIKGTRVFLDFFVNRILGKESNKL